MKSFPLVLSILLGGCIVLDIPPPPTSQDTLFVESERNWVEVYRHELAVALENNDLEAMRFFFQELKKEKQRIEFKEKEK